MKPIAVFTLTIRTHRGQRSRKKLEVLIWEYLKDLRAAAKRSSTRSAYYWSEAAGAYNGVKVYKNGRMIRFGRIHLHKPMIGAGYFSHEFQHFVIHYTEETEVLPLDPEADERIAWMAGDLTAQFWTKFYEYFDVL